MRAEINQAVRAMLRGHGADLPTLTYPRRPEGPTTAPSAEWLCASDTLDPRNFSRGQLSELAAELDLEAVEHEAG